MPVDVWFGIGLETENILWLIVNKHSLAPCFLLRKVLRSFELLASCFRVN